MPGALFRGGNPGESLAILGDATRIVIEEPAQAVVLRTRALMQLGRLEEAGASLEHLRQMAPGHPAIPQIEDFLGAQNPMTRSLFLLACVCTFLLNGGCDDPKEGPDSHVALPAHVDQAWFAPEATERGLDFVLDTELDEEYWLPEIIVGGGAAIDFNDDGWMDLYLLQAAGDGHNRLYQNMGDGTFKDVTSGSGAADDGYGSGAATGDVDGDGDVDIFISNLGPDVLLLNQGNGRFTDVTQESGLGDEGWGTSATFFDADSDGDLDLFVCRYSLWSPETVLPCLGLSSDERGYCKPNRYPATTDLLYLNNGMGQFERVAGQGNIDQVEGYGLGVVAADFDGDGAADLFVANDTLPDRLWLNKGGGAFEEAGFAWACDRDNSGLAKAGMGVTVADMNDDGAPDLLVCNIKGETDSLYLNSGSFFKDITAQTGLSGQASATHGSAWGLMDFNNDGQLDYFAANGAVNADMTILEGDPFAQRNLLLKGRGTRWGSRNSRAWGIGFTCGAHEPRGHLQ